MAHRESGADCNSAEYPPVVPVDEATIAVDVFEVRGDPADGPEMIGTQRLGIELDRSWTVADIVAYANDLGLVERDEIASYDTVCYRVEPAYHCLPDGRNLRSGTKVIRLPPDAVVAERVPSDRLPRVTISAYDRYRWLYHLP
ncbi:hypothetical protein [Halalkalicoccus salilacus]|uniref:hypothetical protein n=1 Tax=Halalkalicoccus salilacus TaxID=3117459 RepID=UPI00300F3208